jgi:uncharacterized membrane protein required for colicin V production
MDEKPPSIRVRIVLWLLALSLVAAFLVFGGYKILDRFFGLLNWQTTTSG